MKTREIYENFKLGEKVIQCVPFGSGHINTTYRLITEGTEKRDFLLQKINHHVFKDIVGLMSNIDRVTDHIRSKITPIQVEDGLTTLKLIQTKSGELFYKDSGGSYWRVFDFLNDLRSYDYAESHEQVHEGALSFGRFLVQLADFPAQGLHITIPRFHDLMYRLDNLNLAMEVSAYDRKTRVREDLLYIFEVADQLLPIQRLGVQKKIPLRVTHNDTKFNNVLLGNDNKGKCVIDLDTVMPGYVHYDFGDGVRTTINTVDEDEKDLNLIDADMERFEAFASGYLEMSHSILTPLEIDHLALSGPLFAFIMGVRFMTDYLLGDQYYKIEYEEHNLDRARCQLTLTKKLMNRLKDMEDTVAKLATSKASYSK